MTVESARRMAPRNPSEGKRLASMVNEIRRAVDTQTEQIAALTDAIEKQAEIIKPLAEHTPELLEMVRAWKATKDLGTTAKRIQSFFTAISKFLRNIGALAVAIVALYLLWKGKFFTILGLPNV
jgi:hypothetical protein